MEASSSAKSRTLYCYVKDGLLGILEYGDVLAEGAYDFDRDIDAIQISLEKPAYGHEFVVLHLHKRNDNPGRFAVDGFIFGFDAPRYPHDTNVLEMLRSARKPVDFATFLDCYDQSALTIIDRVDRACAMLDRLQCPLHLTDESREWFTKMLSYDPVSLCVALGHDGKWDYVKALISQDIVNDRMLFDAIEKSNEEGDSASVVCLLEIRHRHFSRRSNDFDL